MSTHLVFSSKKYCPHVPVQQVFKYIFRNDLTVSCDYLGVTTSHLGSDLEADMH